MARARTSHLDSGFIRAAQRLIAASVRQFRQAAVRTKDPAMASFVARYLPMEEQHEAAARALRDTAVAGISRMPVIKPPSAGGNMPVIPPAK